jgi:ribosomal protein L29
MTMVGKKLGEVPTDKQFLTDVESVGRTPGTSFKNAVNPEIENLKTAYAEERFNAADAVLETRKLRAAARKNLRSPDPAKNELGDAQLSISNAIESQMERYGESIGQTGLIKKFREARQSLAKINSVERAIKNGNVDAQVLAKQLDKGVPLSGNLKTIASVAQEFPNVTRNAAKIKQQSPVNMTDTAVATTAALVSGNPAALAAMAVRPVVRKVLTSERYQNSLAKPKAKPANEIAKQPEKRNALLEY